MSKQHHPWGQGQEIRCSTTTGSGSSSTQSILQSPSLPRTRRRSGPHGRALRQGQQEIPAGRRTRRPRPPRPGRQFPGTTWPFRLWQDHCAANRRRPRAPNQRQLPHRRAGRDEVASAGAGRRDGLPELRPVPHLSVAENISYPLRVRKIPKPRRLEQAARVAALLDIDSLLDRKPGQLSGGPRQRVALARAIIWMPACRSFARSRAASMSTTPEPLPLSPIGVGWSSRWATGAASCRTRCGSTTT
jgi:hypothetical protein